MSRRLFFTRNRPANVDNHYIVGSGVGSKSRFVRSALRRRSSNNAHGKPCCFPIEHKTLNDIDDKEKPIYCQRENEIYNECGNACTATCDDPNPICTEQCVKRCECRKGHVLHEDKCIPKHHCQDQNQCPTSYTSYQIKDTSMCCWTDDIGPDGSGCKNKNSVCYLGASGGLLQVCPKSNIINCTDVKYKCDTQKGACVPDLTGTEASYNTCASQCSPRPPPPSPSGLPAVKKVIYLSDYNIASPTTGWAAVTAAIKESIEASFNILNLSFITTGGGDFQIPDAKSLYTTGNLIDGWWWKWMKQDDTGLVDDISQSNFINNYVHKNNALLFVSAGGANDKPWIPYPNGTQYGEDIAKWVVAKHLDGIDFDLENIANGFLIDGKTSKDTIQWIMDATTGAYNIFNPSTPKPNAKKYFISHAPQAPYIGPLNVDLTCSATKRCWADNITCTNKQCTPPFTGDSGGYSNIYHQLQEKIDFFNVQFYNQIDTRYDTYEHLIHESQAWQYGTAYQQINSYGIPYDKIVIGKPIFTTDVYNTGYITEGTLNDIYRKLKEEIPADNKIHTMGWQYHAKKDMTPAQKDQFGNWINTVYNGI